MATTMRHCHSDGDLPAKPLEAGVGEDGSSSPNLDNNSSSVEGLEIVVGGDEKGVGRVFGGMGSGKKPSMHRQSTVLSLVFENSSTLAPSKVTRAHWKPDHEATECYNLSCRKAFNFFERKHHCRRCGNIFCSSCLDFEIKLDANAEPSLTGVLSKVCNNCYAEYQVIALAKPKANSYSGEGEHETVKRLKKQESVEHLLLAEEKTDGSPRPRESSDDTLVSEEARKKFLDGVDHADYLTRRRRTLEFLEKRLARRPSMDEIADKMKDWDWSTF